MEMKSIGVLLGPVLFMSLASAAYAKGGPKNDDPGEALPLPIPTIETGLVVAGRGTALFQYRGFLLT